MLAAYPFSDFWMALRWRFDILYLPSRIMPVAVGVADICEIATITIH